MKEFFLNKILKSSSENMNLTVVIAITVAFEVALEIALVDDAFVAVAVEVPTVHI